MITFIDEGVIVKKLDEPTEPTYADLVGSCENPPRKIRKKRTKTERLTNPYEWEIQRATVKLLRLVLPADYIVVAHAQESSSESENRYAKLNGQWPGYPDLEILGDGRVWLIEMKDAKGRLTKAQKDFHILLKPAKIPILSICRSPEQACAWLAKNGARINWKR